MEKKKIFGSLKAKILFRFLGIMLILIVVGRLFWNSSKNIREAKEQVIAYTNDQMLLQTAVTDHYQWAGTLNSSINYKIEFTGSADPKLCRFGKFLYSDKVQKNSKWNDFVKEIEPLHNKIHEEARELLIQNDPKQAKAVYLDEINPTLDKLVIKLNEYIEMHKNKINAIEEKETWLLDRLFIAITGQIVILLLLLINLYFFIRREVIHPVHHFAEECERLSKGQLSLNFVVKCKNMDVRRLGHALNNSILELKKYITDIDRAMGEMSNRNFNVIPNQPFIGDFKPIENSIGKMITDMSSILLQMDVAAKQVAGGAEQMSNGAQILAQGSTQQASSIEELSATITKVSEYVQQTADNSDKASDMANNATAAVTASNNQMQQLMDSMNVIDAQSKQIRKIIKVIEDIAFQTNILALNAAVEAARAGKAGEGFAVVAEEVRSLAAKSADAAKNTTELIEDSIAAIDKGVRFAQSTVEDLLDVVEETNETTAVIMEITKAAKKQAHDISQITTGLEQISLVVQQNSATSEESAAASEELSSQAILLEEIIDSFELFKGIPS